MNTVRPRSLRAVFSYFLPYLRRHVAVLCMVGAAVMELLRPWPLKLVFDELLVPQPDSQILSSVPLLGATAEGQLAAVALAILAIAFFGGLFSYGQLFLTASVGEKVAAKVRKRLYAHLQRLSHSFHDQNSTGDLLARLTGDIRLMRDMMATSLIYIADRALILAGMLAVMLIMDWQLTLVTVAVFPLLVLTVANSARRIKGATRKRRSKESEITADMNEKLTAISVVKAFSRENYEDKRFSTTNRMSMRAGLRSTRIEAGMHRLVQIILAIGTAAVIWFGVQRVQAGVLTPGDLLVFAAYLKSTYKPIRRLSTLTSRLAKAVVSGERIIELFETKPEIADAPDAREAPRFTGRIRFDDVNFSYAPGVAVLNGLDLDIAPGETVAFIGASGAGKSTVPRLILRFYDAESGRVLIDEVDVRNYTLDSLRQQIAIVLQEPDLFNASVRDNIGYGRLDASDDDIERAARLANAHEFILELPQGYDTLLSERGASLSGGQRQRIAIARAIVRDAPIVILDEPTTGLDQHNREAVSAALTQLTQGRTCILITHDSELAATADRAIEIRDGGVRSTSATAGAA